MSCCKLKVYMHTLSCTSTLYTHVLAFYVCIEYVQCFVSCLGTSLHGANIWSGRKGDFQDLSGVLEQPSGRSLSREPLLQFLLPADAVRARSPCKKTTLPSRPFKGIKFTVVYMLAFHPLPSYAAKCEYQLNVPISNANIKEHERKCVLVVHDKQLQGGSWAYVDN